MPWLIGRSISIEAPPLDLEVLALENMVLSCQESRLKETPKTNYLLPEYVSTLLSMPPYYKPSNPKP